MFTLLSLFNSWMSTVHYRHLPEAVAKFEAAGGWALKAKVASVLNGLGFTDADAWPLLAP